MPSFFRSQFGRALLRATLITIIALLVVFVAGAELIQTSVRQVIYRQEVIRRAELGRSLVMRLQLDEESSVRGYTVTGKQAFLQPFYEARAQVQPAFARLKSRLRLIAPTLIPVVQEQQRINALWLATVAQPLIAHRSGTNNAVLELYGKGLVDRFRLISAGVSSSLNQIADAGDRAASSTIARILIGCIVFGLLLIVALLFYMLTQARLIRELAMQTRENENLRRFAATLQEAFLVEPLPHIKTLEFDAVYMPALVEERVGGDWYGVFPLPDGRVYFSMGDVAGHGVSAAVTMARIRQTILSIAMNEPDPGIVLARANGVLRLRTDAMVTAACGFVDPVTFEVSYASAGHSPPLLVTQDGKAGFLPTSGLPLGIVSNLNTQTYMRRVAPGSMLVLYTDGIVEFDRNILRGERKLLKVSADVFRDNVDLPARAILGRSLGGALQLDDIALLVIRFGSVTAGLRGKGDLEIAAP